LLWTWTKVPVFPSENLCRGMTIEGGLTNGALEGRLK
jgi:hypothetical protein